MELLIFRHGPAVDRDAWKSKGEPDSKRPLTADGRKKTAKAADGLAALLDGLDAIVSSPLVRALETADILAARFRKAKRRGLDALAQGEPPAGVIKGLKELADFERVALVGHEPQLSALIGALIGAPRALLELKKAGAALLSVEAPRAGGARLLWLLQPSQLRALR